MIMLLRYFFVLALCPYFAGGQSNQKRRLIRRQDVQRALMERTSYDMLLKIEQLNDVSVDWERLRDGYLTAVYSEELDIHRRQLQSKKRSPRAHRKRSWDLLRVENELKQKAEKAVEEAREYADKRKADDADEEGAATRKKGVRGSKRSGSNAPGEKVTDPKELDDKDPEHATPLPTKHGGRGGSSRGPRQNPNGDAEVGGRDDVSSGSVQEEVIPETTTSSGSRGEGPRGRPSSPADDAINSPNKNKNNKKSFKRSSSYNNKAAPKEDKEFPIMVTTEELNSPIAGTNTDDRQGGNDPSFNGQPINIYTPGGGNCPDVGDSDQMVPCAPDDINLICDKYEDEGSFEACFNACMPSFCCIHDADKETNFIAPNCNMDVNCAQYGYCYIVWWKLHDTIGPATQLQLEQTDDFFDVDASFVEGDVTNMQFYREVLFHHFDDANEIVRLGTMQVDPTLSVFNSDLIFLNETYWNTTI